MDTMGSDDTSTREGLPEGFFEMEIISNAPNNVELNQQESDPEPA